MVQTVNNIGKQSDAENFMIQLLLRFEANTLLITNEFGAKFRITVK